MDDRPVLVGLDLEHAGALRLPPTTGKGGPVSVSTAGPATSEEVSRAKAWSRPEPIRLRLFEWGTFLVTIGVFLALALTRGKYIEPSLARLIPWLFLVILADLLVVPVWCDLRLALSLPILLSAAMVFPLLAAGVLAFAGYCDVRKFRREISMGHGLFNRSQVALSVIAASWIFHELDGDLEVWPFVLVAGSLAVLADMLVNNSLVVIGWRLAGLGSFGDALSGVGGGRPIPLMLSYLALGLAAVLLAVVYSIAGNWALTLFAIPVILAWQSFDSESHLRDLARALSRKTHALANVSERIADERLDERLTVAAGLHDELLPPIYKVHLMGQVLRQDLATGRLLNLEDDLPELLGATEQASRTTQSLIRSLRGSPVGVGGLTGSSSFWCAMHNWALPAGWS